MSTRDRFIGVAAQLFARHGYTGIGLKQIANRTEAPIGSLYHFFPGGKDELVAESLRHAGDGYLLLVESVLDNAPDLETGIRACFSTAAAHLELSDYQDGCPIETVALEVASTNEPLRQVTSEIFEHWIERATEHARRQGLDASTSRSFGIAFITGLEGAFVLARTMRSPEPLLATGEHLCHALRAGTHDAST